MDPEKIEEEIRTAMRVFRQGEYAVVDVTDKPIETSADEIIKLITARSLPRRADGS